MRLASVCLVQPTKISIFLVHLPDEPEEALATTSATPGCFKLRILSLIDVEKVSPK